MVTQLIDDPEPEDSPNLTDEEIEVSIPTSSVEDVVTHLKGSPRPDMMNNELLRRGDHLYWRVTMGDKVLIFQADWLANGPSY